MKRKRIRVIKTISTPVVKTVKAVKTSIAIGRDRFVIKNLDK